MAGSYVCENATRPIHLLYRPDRASGRMIDSARLGLDVSFGVRGSEDLILESLREFPQVVPEAGYIGPFGTTKLCGHLSSLGSCIEKMILKPMPSPIFREMGKRSILVHLFVFYCNELPTRRIYPVKCS